VKNSHGFANGLGAILNGEHSLASFLSKKSSPSILGLLQQYLPAADIATLTRFPLVSAPEQLTAVRATALSDP
jgi:hypothetical protein